MRIVSQLVAMTGLVAAAEFVHVPESILPLRDTVTGFTFQVTIPAFLAGATEVTQQEYARVTGQSPSAFRGPQRPVENVSWWDAVRYGNRRSVLEGLRPCYDATTGERISPCSGYRLPTSAEFAVLAGAKPPAGALLRTGNHRDEAELLALKGPRDANSGPADPRGLFHVYGNVWEWCEDWFNAEPYVDAVVDPRGPSRGVERVIRGGSVLTTATAWNRGYVSSMRPSRLSPFTGFRVVKHLPAADVSTRPLSRAAGKGSPALERTWLEVLGQPKVPARKPAVSTIQRYRELTWKGELLDLEVEPGFPARVLIVEPLHKRPGPLPVVIVPFYDVDSPAGTNLGGRRFSAGGARAFALLAAMHGYLGVAVRWFAEGDAENYDEAVWHLAARHPEVTPLGKWIYDARRLVDYIVTRPDVDTSRIAIMGHSLGGKMALYAAAFEPRIAATVSSEPGLGLSFSNYFDFWYLGGRHRLLPEGSDHHQLLSLISPRPFLLIAGESADGEKSRAILDRSPGPAEMINHRSGHSPTEDSLHRAMNWLGRALAQR